ncbi:MAG: aminotransferase class I/II-fold pyridoxal phosphate-dependent enzyme [Cytophagales bacterium]
MPKIWLSSPHIGEKELEYVKNAFETNWIAPLGPHVDAFEQSIQDFTACGHAAALSSGTAALHLALVLLGIQSGDEVIASTFTFSATVNPIVYQKAIPVLVDSEKDTWNMCPDLLEEAIKDRISRGKKPKAVIVVHLYGQSAKIEELQKICRQHEIPLIEDAAESLGASFKGKMTGTFGDFGIYSFNGNKIITTSGGGALVSQNEDYIKKARFLATQARDQAPHYQHSQIGYNYRLSNVLAGIGRGQMEVLAERIAQRRSNFEFYKNRLGKHDGISFLPELEDSFANRWLTCILVDPQQTKGKTREDLRKHLETLNIESRPLWKPMHKQPIFEKYPYYGKRLSEQLFENGLCLPSGSNLSQDDLERVVKGIDEALA